MTAHVRFGMPSSKLYITLLPFYFATVFSFPDQGQWSRSFTSVSYAYFGAHKSLSSGSTVSLTVNCEPSDASEKVDIELGWILRQTSCFEEYYLEPDLLGEEVLQMYYNCPMNSNSFSSVRFLKSEPVIVECSSRIHLEFVNSSFIPNAETTEIPISLECNRNYPPVTAEVLKATTKKTASNDVHASGQEIPVESNHVTPRQSISNRRLLENKPAVQAEAREKVGAASVQEQGLPSKISNTMHKNSSSDTSQKSEEGSERHEQLAAKSPLKLGVPLGSDAKDGYKIAAVDMDGVYLLVLKVKALDGKQVNLTVAATMKGPHGYLSAVDYPLLWFYGFMCGLYVLYAFSWLVVSALQWRDLLRIQFWIGGVILLGLIEKAVFYEEYHTINNTGQSVQGAVLFAEILSCMKRTLARMLVIIVSLGFGIVKPRLGPVLHRVVGVGALYFFLGTLEGCLRVLKPKNDLSKQALIAGIPLAVTDSAICWWIFSSLVQTIRTLRLRRNLVKLSLYRHFTNTLIFAVLASVAFMIWSIHSHKLVTCITDWKELWVDEAYWHLLFSLVLLVIMILWRPTQNNQRYAFTPLLDAADDENDDDFDANLTNDAFDGMKMRAYKNQPGLSPSQNDSKNKQDEDLKWVEENIPASLTEVALPSLLDSDEEIMTAKFERNKME